jgi:hypothetical protein
MASSSDGAQTWKPPVDVTAGLELAFRTRPGIAVDPRGSLAVTWFESADRGPCGDVVVRISRDGGATFGAPNTLRRGSAPCPSEGVLGRIVDRWRGGGDYAGIQSVLTGTFDLVWADARADGHHVRFARIRP